MPSIIHISNHSTRRSPQVLDSLHAMVSVPCFLYNVRADRYISVSKFLRDRLGTETFVAGFSKLIDRIHPFDRPNVVRVNNMAMELIENHKEGEDPPELHNLTFRVLDQNDQWLHCIMKLDVAGYDCKGKVNELFGVFWLNQKKQKYKSGCKTNSPYDRECQHAEKTGERHRESEDSWVCNSVTDRERDVVNLISEGKCTKEIAGILGISFHTVETHRKKLLSKFHAHNAVELIQILVAKGLWAHP